MHRAAYALGRDLEAVCNAQFEARQEGVNPKLEPHVEAALDAGAHRLVKYCMDMVHVLTTNGVIPYLVFDGDSLPAKKATEADRYKCESRCPPLRAFECWWVFCPSESAKRPDKKHFCS